MLLWTCIWAHTLSAACACVTLEFASKIGALLACLWFWLAPHSGWVASSWHFPLQICHLSILRLQVYEQRALPDPVNRNLDRSYHLAMSHRGMGAVEKVSLLHTPLSHAASC